MNDKKIIIIGADIPIGLVEELKRVNPLATDIKITNESKKIRTGNFEVWKSNETRSQRRKRIRDEKKGKYKF